MKTGTAKPRAPRALTPADYLQKILTARVYDVAIETPLEPARTLSRRLHNKVLLKREDQQPVFSFKLRGAYNKLAHLTPEQLKRGVICASAGNHAQGVAFSANRLGCRALIVMPTTTPQVKIDAVRAHGGEVVLHGDSYSDAYAHALTLQKKQGLTFAHPFDDPDVIAGQGTIAMEMLRQHQGPLDAVFVGIGGGGLIAGVAAYIKAVRPEVKVIGVQTQDSCAMVQSVKAGKRLVLGDVGLTTSAPGESARIAANFKRQGFATLDLSHDDLAQEHIRHLVGGPSSLAKDERLLRFIFPERPGALLKFLSLMQPNWNISLFHYRNQAADYGRILVGMQVPKADDKAFKQFLATLGYAHVEETLNPAYRMFLQA